MWLNLACSNKTGRSLELLENLWDAALVDALEVVEVPRLAVPLLGLRDAVAARL